jgi:protein gp37
MAARFSGSRQPFEGFAVRATYPKGSRYEALNARWTGRVELIPEKLQEPLHWRKPRRIFVCSMSDLFHENLPDKDIGKIFGVMAEAYKHTFLILTKRPKRLLEWSRAVAYYPQGNRSQRPLPGWPPNVWLGVSCENQETADERIPLLLQTPAAKRFVSLEPLLGSLNILPYIDPEPCDHIRLSCEEIGCCGMTKLDWVIVGGESRPNARPCEINWIRSIVQQCKVAKVPVFVKQDSDLRPGKQGRIPNDLWLKEFPKLMR